MFNKYGLSRKTIKEYIENYPELMEASKKTMLKTIAELEHRKVCKQFSSYCENGDLVCRECVWWKHGLKVQMAPRG